MPCSRGFRASFAERAADRSPTRWGIGAAGVRAATAAAILPEGDGYLAALSNFRIIANARSPHHRSR